MKNFIILFLCLVISVQLGIRTGQAVPKDNLKNTKIYYLDRRLHRLIPISYTPKSRMKSKIAKEMVYQLCEKKTSDQILTLVPDKAEEITIKIDGTKAVIDLDKSLAEILPKNCETEQLFIFQLVNSLCTIDEITSVRFTINGKSEKDFLGFIDMREIFTPKDVI